MQDKTAMANTTAGSKQTQGRPRDPNLEARVFHTVMQLYASGGWQSLTFDAVAREAGVGKAALYRRWSSRGELFYDALKVHWFEISSIDTANLEGDLTALARMLFDRMSGPYGHTHFFLQADARKFEDVGRAISAYRGQMINEARAVVHRAIRRGELPEKTDANLIMDVIVGAISNHVTATPPGKKDQMIARAPEYLENLIRLVVQGQMKAQG